MAFILLILTFAGIHWLWGYSILYWIGDEREKIVSIRFIRMGILVTILSHLGWILIRANWWGVLIVDAGFVLTATSIAVAVSRTVRLWVFTRIGRSQ